jgi:hypothetical protein
MNRTTVLIIKIFILLMFVSILLPKPYCNIALGILYIIWGLTIVYLKFIKK